MTTRLEMFDLPREQIAGQFDWIVGPVLRVTVIVGTPYRIVQQSAMGAYAVVDVEREYHACCPSQRYAIAAVKRLIEQRA